MSATVNLIVEDGYSALTIERVAVRASVSRAALYRRWPNKQALVVDAIEAFAHNQVPLPDTGRLRDDITEFLRNMVRAREADMEAYEALSAALVAHRELAERCKDTLVATFAASFRTIVTRAVDRGELPRGTDIELLADLAPALARYRRQVRGERLNDAFIDRLANQFFPPAISPPTTPATGSEKPVAIQQRTDQVVQYPIRRRPVPAQSSTAQLAPTCCHMGYSERREGPGNQPESGRAARSGRARAGARGDVELGEDSPQVVVASGGTRLRW